MKGEGYCSPWVLGVVNVVHPTSSPAAFPCPLWCQLYSWSFFQHACGNTDADVDRLWVTLRTTLAWRSNGVPALGVVSSTLLACPVLTIFLKLITQRHYFNICFLALVSQSPITDTHNSCQNWRGTRVLIRSLAGKIGCHSFPGPWASGLAWAAQFPADGVLYPALWEST